MAGVAEPSCAVQPGVNPKRHPHSQGNHGGHNGQLQGRGHAFGYQLGHRALMLIGKSEFALHRVTYKAQELHRSGIIKPQRLAQLLPFCKRCVLPHHLVNGVSHVVEHGKGDKGHEEHDHHGLN
jgi:hypothetical protein